MGRLSTALPRTGSVEGQPCLPEQFPEARSGWAGSQALVRRGQALAPYKEVGPGLTSSLPASGRVCVCERVFLSLPLGLLEALGMGGILQTARLASSKTDLGLGC